MLHVKHAGPRVHATLEPPALRFCGLGLREHAPLTACPPLASRLQMDFSWFGRNIEEYMAQKGTPVKRLVFDESGIGSVEARLPGVHFPVGEDPGEEGYVGKVILPDKHVGDIVLPDVPPMDLDGGIGEGLVEDSDGLDGQDTGAD